MYLIVTDSASDISAREAREMGILLVNLPVIFDNIDYAQDSDEGFNDFYRYLEESKVLPTTSQVPPGEYFDIFTEAKERGGDVLVITLSSGLSGTYNSAVMAKEMSGNDNVFIVDSMHATLSQRILIEYAVRMRDEGKSAAEAAEAISSVKDRVTVVGLLNTLTNLKKGGRIPPSLAVLGNALGVKVVVVLKDGKIEPLGKARGFNNGKKILWDEFLSDEKEAG
jgi:DegV family protein with EDD domain